MNPILKLRINGIIAVLTILFSFVSVWHMTSPQVAPVKPTLYSLYESRVNATVVTDVVAGTVSIYFGVYCPQVVIVMRDIHISFSVFLLNFTASVFGRGVHLDLVNVKVWVDGHSYDFSYGWDSRNPDIGGFIELAFDEEGNHSILVEISVRIISVLIIGWLPDRIITQKLLLNTVAITKF